MPPEPTQPDPWDILSAPDAGSRLARAREHLDQALRELGELPTPHHERDDMLGDFAGVVSWHEHMQDVLGVALAAGGHRMSAEQIAAVTETMTRMGALLALAEPFDDAAARLRSACRSLQDQVYGPIWNCEDELRRMALGDAALADKLREVGLLAELDDEPVDAARAGGS